MHCLNILIVALVLMSGCSSEGLKQDLEPSSIEQAPPKVETKEKKGSDSPVSTLPSKGEEKLRTTEVSRVEGSQIETKAEERKSTEENNPSLVVEENHYFYHKLVQLNEDGTLAGPIFELGDPEAEEMEWDQLYQKVSSGIVQIGIHRMTLENRRKFKIERHRFTSDEGERTYLSELLEESYGTGFFIREDLILTNLHVVDGGYSAMISAVHALGFLPWVEGRVVWRSPHFGADLALIQLDEEAVTEYKNQLQSVGKELHVFKFSADSGSLSFGQDVATIGNLNGNPGKFISGVLQSMDWDRCKGEEKGGLYPYLVSDISIGPGNSGGPLINRRGHVLGVVNGDRPLYSDVPNREDSPVIEGVSVPGAIAMGLLRTLPLGYSKTGVYDEGSLDYAGLCNALFWTHGSTTYQLSQMAKGDDDSIDICLSPKVVKVLPAFNHLGLEKGDVILKWNGAPIRQISKYDKFQFYVVHPKMGKIPFELAMTISQNTTVSVEILRDGEMHFIERFLPLNIEKAIAESQLLDDLVGEPAFETLTGLVFFDTRNLHEIGIVLPFELAEDAHGVFLYGFIESLAVETKSQSRFLNREILQQSENRFVVLEYFNGRRVDTIESLSEVISQTRDSLPDGSLKIVSIKGKAYSSDGSWVPLAQKSLLVKKLQ